VVDRAGTSQQALGNADVVLMVGTEVLQAITSCITSKFAANIIRIDIDPVQLASKYAAVVGIQAMRALPCESGDSIEHPEGSLPAISRRGPRTEVSGQRRKTDGCRKAACARVENRAFGASRDAIVMGDASQIVYTELCDADGSGKCWYYSGNVLRAGCCPADGCWRENRRADRR